MIEDNFSFEAVEGIAESILGICDDVKEGSFSEFDAKMMIADYIRELQKQIN